MKVPFGNRIKHSWIVDANDFVDFWNDIVDKYGWIARSDVYDYLGYFDSSYTGNLFGWDKKISAKKNLCPCYSKEHVYWKLNPPKEKRLKHKN